MRVLEVLGASSGGIARHVAEIVAGLDGKDGLTIDVAAPPSTPVDMGKPVLHVTIPDGPLRGHRAARRRLRELLVAGAYDVVHAHGLRAGIDSALAARSTRAATIASVHNVVLPQLAGRTRSRIYRLAEPLVVLLNDRVLAPSEDIARRLRAAAPRRAQKVGVVHLGVGDDARVDTPATVIREELGIKPNDKLIVSVARLSPQKALHVMIEALPRLDADVVLALVGDGPLEQRLRDHAKQAGVDERVRFVGWRNNARDYTAAADVFCLSSVWEACALAAQEAILLGVPVVSTNVGGMDELVRDGRTGRLVPPGDPVALAAALEHVLASQSTRQRYVDAARVHLKERFSTEKMLDAISRAYAEAAS